MNDRAELDAALAMLQDVVDFYDNIDLPHAPGEAKLLDSVAALLARHPSRTRPTKRDPVTLDEELRRGFSSKGIT